jgi:hypothetical protein
MADGAKSIRAAGRVWSAGARENPAAWLRNWPFQDFGTAVWNGWEASIHPRNSQQFLHKKVKRE